MKIPDFESKRDPGFYMLKSMCDDCLADRFQTQELNCAMVQTRSAARYSGQLRDRQLRGSSSSLPGYEPVPFCGIKSIDAFVQYDCDLNEEKLRRLASHKYAAVDTSWLDDLCMKKFWEYVVNFYPLWVAPNFITLVGLLVNLFTVLILARYSSSASEDAPRWTYFLSALGLFVYQTLDATDGKQARRTCSSSPLGELFDHGCDSISQIFITLNVCYALQLGMLRGAVFFVCILSITMFYCAHWSTYCTGQLRFCRFDVTEAQMSVIALLLITSVVGPQFWSIGIFPGYTLKHALLLLTTAVSSRQLIGYLTTIVNEGSGKNGSTVAGTSVLFPVFPLLAVIVPFCMVYTKSRSAVFDENISIFCLLFGFVAAKATNRLIVAHMSRSELSLWDWIYAAPLTIMLNQYYDFLLDERKLLFVAAVYAFLSLVVYSAAVTRELCSYLNIKCFSIPPLSEAQKSQ